MDCIITIEIGASAIRISAFELSGNLICTEKGSFPTFNIHPDYSEQDPEQIFITLLNLLKNFLSESINPRKYNILSICFSGAMHTLLPVDKKGIPLGNAIVWSDNRGKKEAKELKNSALGDKIYSATGTPIHPMSPLIKIAWLRKNDPRRFQETYKFISIKDYIIQQLTGEYLTDFSLASSTGLFNFSKLKWDSDALDFAGVVSEKLPEPTEIFFSGLRLRNEYRTSLGLSTEVKLIIGASDGCLATLGVGVYGDGKATVTLDTTGAVRVAGQNIIRDKKQRFFNYLLTKDHFVSGGPTNNGGVVFEWFARQFGFFNDASETDEIIESLIMDASLVRAGADGLLFLPYLLGERAPLWNADARGLFFGLNIRHEQKHFIRATLEGILYEIYSIGKMLEEHRTINHLCLNGKYAGMPFWSQLIADMFGKKVYSNDNYDSIGVGAFLISLTALGIHTSLTEASKCITFSKEYNPNMDDHQTYMKLYKIFERLSYKLEEEFAEIAAFQQE